MARNDAFRELRKVREQAGGAPQHYRSTTCEVRGCTSGKRGAKGTPDIAIHDAQGNVMGWSCESCYDRIIHDAGRGPIAQVERFAAQAHQPRQQSFTEHQRAEHIADVLRSLGDCPDFDRYADSMQDQVDE